MATIQDYLNLIKTAIYGKDVRQAIHDGIQQCYYDGRAGATDLSARQRLDTAEPKITSLESRMSTAEDDIDVLDARVDQIVAPTGEAPSAAEVADARIGADGKTYTSLGEANRTQFSEISESTKNLFNFDDTDADFSVYKQYGTTGVELLPAGTYTFSAEITSDNSKCAVIAYTSSQSLGGDIPCNTGGRTLKTFTASSPIERIYLYAGTNLSDAAGHTALFKDIQIEVGDTATSFVEPRSAFDSVARANLLKIGNNLDNVMLMKADEIALEKLSAFVGKSEIEDYVENNVFVNGYLNTENPPSVIASSSQLTSMPFYIGKDRTLKIKVGAGYRAYINYYDDNFKKQSGQGYYTSDTVITTLQNYMSVSITKNPYSSGDNISVSEKSNIKICIDVTVDEDNLLKKIEDLSKFKTRNLWEKGDVSATGYVIYGTVGVELLPKGKYTVSGIFDSEDPYITFTVYGENSTLFTKQITPSANKQCFQIDTGDEYINRFFFLTSSGSSSTKTFSVDELQVESRIWNDYQHSDSSDFSAMPYITDYVEPYIGIEEKVEENHSKWEGKKIVYNGDSITQGIYTADGGARTGYVKVVNKLLKFGAVDNFAIGGTRLAHIEDEADCLVDRIEDMSTDGDIVFIMANTNDYASQVPLGSADSTDISTYNGALNTIFTWLKNNYKQQPIIVSTMLTRKINYDPVTHNPLPIPIEDYAQAVRDRVADYHFILYDAYNWSGLDLRNSATDNTGVTNDNLHPNMFGAQLLGQKIASFIEMQ